MEKLTSIISSINEKVLWGIPMILAIIGVGLFFTIITKFLQVRKFKTALKSTIYPSIKGIGKGKTDKDKVSPFQAFATAISGSIGTGNIVGVVGAIILGGPGAVFWMWVSAFFGLLTNFIETVLSLYYREKNEKGEIVGGPMYYITNGLNKKWLAIIFAVCCLFASVGMGMVQSNSISGVLQTVIAPNSVENAKIVAIVVGVTVSLLTTLIIIGGIKRIGKVASVVVPFMAMLCIIMSLIVIAININALPKAFYLIVSEAFSFKAVSGGFLGYTILVGMRYGFARGIFSNEAGLGSAPIAHASSSTKEPVKQGMWGMFAVFVDTFIVCSMTAFALITTSLNSGAFDWTNISQNALLDKNVIAPFAFTQNFGGFGSIVFSIIMPLFAFTTILAWAFYGEKAIEFLCGRKSAKVGTLIFKLVFVVLLIVGALVSSKLVWELDDCFNALMAVPNLIAIVMLSKVAIKVTKNYFDRRRGVDVEPMLSFDKETNDKLIKELKEENQGANLLVERD